VRDTFVDQLMEHVVCAYPNMNFGHEDRLYFMRVINEWEAGKIPKVLTKAERVELLKNFDKNPRSQKMAVMKLDESLRLKRQGIINRYFLDNIDDFVELSKSADAIRLSRRNDWGGHWCGYASSFSDILDKTHE